MKQHVDLAVLGALREVMEGEYPALLAVFIKDSEQRVRALNAAMSDPGLVVGSRAQRQQLVEMAHSFKGSSSNMGATHLTELCRQLEEQARGTVVLTEQQVRQMVTAINDEFRIVRDVFEVELHSILI